MSTINPLRDQNRGELRPGLYTLYGDTTVLVKSVSGRSYSAVSFPTQLNFTRYLAERLVPLSESRMKNLLIDSEIPTWLANQTRGRPDLGMVVGESLGYRSLMLEELRELEEAESETTVESDN